MEPRHISFGLAATEIAMKAKQGICTDGLRLDLAIEALGKVADDADAVAAVREFTNGSRQDARDAGERLQRFILDWRKEPAAEASPEFDWQRRVDCNG